MSTQKTPLLAIITGLVVCAAASAQVTTLTTLDNGQDARVQPVENADTNYGGAVSLVLKDAGLNKSTSKVYLGFDLSTWNSTAASASVTLTANASFTLSADTNIRFWGLNNGSASWSEDTITYNNAPAADSDPGNGSIDDGASFYQGTEANQMTLLGSINFASSTVFTTGDTITFSDASLTDFINNFSSENLTIGVTIDKNTYTQFYSSGTATGASVAPTLALTPIPEPATAGSIIGVLALTLSVLRRRNFRS
ncbi:CBM96 family carbohydrate-binding protein [Puniceicoccus vermicola]|uniref:DNRLRE domain-containing protein n=1 Tax=Puniceicoccus vermicola TaxID=388746 RepID=A0A7X1E481_9BACT|nr:DNRLRE domain-containing protein [Puniceicoccus vermicola]MBC2600337.1 DNRLRE domain-containing protein [Puniceicoccus vermicola]